MVALIPIRRPIGGDLSQLGELYKGEIKWTPQMPRSLTIGNHKFIPEDEISIEGIDKVIGQGGKIWEYEYAVGKNGKKIYFTSIKDLAIREWLVGAAYKLATLYSTTGKIVYAHKAALIISGFTDALPAYVIYGKPSSGGVYKFFHEEPYPQRSGKWGTWYPLELNSIEPLVLAYDKILPSGVIQQLGDEWHRDLKSDIDQAFLEYCKLVQKYDQWHAKTLAQRTSNVQPYKCRGMIAIGRTIERPDLIHYAFSYIEEMIERRFGLDGVFPESPGYHRQVVGNLNEAFAYLKGYSDPPNYINPLKNRRFDEFDPETEFPTFEKAKDFVRKCSYPDGTPMVVHDTWVKTNSHFKRDATTSRIWPSFGHAVLGRGQGVYQMETHIDYGFGFNHYHNDTLNLILWAFGEELLPDIGYTYTYRGWATGSLSHNLVVVDGMVQNAGVLNFEQPNKAIGGRIVTWAPVVNGFGVVEAEDINSYPQCSTYRRGIAVVEENDINAIIVDVFEVSGGSQHDYMVHGSADKDQTLVFKKPIQFYADSLASDHAIKLPKISKELYGTPDQYKDFDRYGAISQYWGNIRKVMKVQGAGPWEAIFSGNQKSDAGLRMHLLAPTDCDVYTGKAPSIRRANEDPSKIENYMMPIATARREGQDMDSRFVVVWEPFIGKPWLKSVELLQNSANGLIIKVISAESIITFFWTPSSDAVLSSEPVSFKGRFGVSVTSRRSGESRCSTVDGVLAKTSSESLKNANVKILTVVNAKRDEKGDYIEVAEGLNPDEISSRWGILLYPGEHSQAIEIGGVERNNIIRCPKGHGLVHNVNNSTWHEKYSPGRQFKGTLRLRLVRRQHKGLNAPEGFQAND